MALLNVDSEVCWTLNLPYVIPTAWASGLNWQGLDIDIDIVQMHMYARQLTSLSNATQWQNTTPNLQ